MNVLYRVPYLPFNTIKIVATIRRYFLTVVNTAFHTINETQVIDNIISVCVNLQQQIQYFLQFFVNLHVIFDVHY